MWIKRDFLQNFDSTSCLEALYIKGPRQIGKSSLLEKLLPTPHTILFLDDLALRLQANSDPTLVLSQVGFPLLIDEAHLAPELFYALKKIIDQSRRKRRLGEPGDLPAASIRLTGSNLTEVNTSVQETLAGRVSIFFLHGLSWHEIMQHDAKTTLSEYLFRGGFPELWTRKELRPVEFINHYISTFIEKDLSRSLGIEKKTEFLTVLRLLAARVAELLNYDSLGNDAGVKGKTVKQWLALLEENKIIFFLQPYFSNLNKRLIKLPKLYLMDLGICTRLQSHQNAESILSTPHAGHLFECLVISEVVKAKDHFRMEWNLFYWRTKDQEEIDLIIESNQQLILIEVKLSSHGIKEIKIPKTLLELKKNIQCFVVTAVGEKTVLSKSTKSISINYLIPTLLDVQW